jgi:hypothetical protein
MLCNYVQLFCVLLCQYRYYHLANLLVFCSYNWFFSFNLFIILAEQPYDSIPNFSAADALRITGIGRNEFIDIMNKCRSKVFINYTLAFH